VLLAKALGYHPSPLEFRGRSLPPEERLPRVAIELAHRALRDGAVLPRPAAEMLGIDELGWQPQYRSWRAGFRYGLADERPRCPPTG